MDTFSWQTIKFLKTFLQTQLMESNNTLRLLCVYCGKTLRISLSQLPFRWSSLLYLHNCLSYKSDLFWERFCEVYRDMLSTEQQGRERKQSTAQYRDIFPQWVWSSTIASYCNKEHYNNWPIKGQTISLQPVVGHIKSVHQDHMDLNLRTALYVSQIRYIYLVQISSPPQKEGLTPTSMLPSSKQQIHQRQVGIHRGKSHN